MIYYKLIKCSKPLSEEKYNRCITTRYDTNSRTFSKQNVQAILVIPLPPVYILVVVRNCDYTDVVHDAEPNAGNRLEYAMCPC